ncbi:glycosyltransferase [Gordonia phage GodonK]|uniref:Glycosyltransferase n=1 Tax=Gordonia phage GodonK TaxID=2562192 RepID=A0A4D6E2K3_9CAUD|nr:glycosyltransferase [Gordonia phage GodonK]QBZ72734.1 glycosyltransferase [Gordonia phage GodonK]
MNQSRLTDLPLFWINLDSRSDKRQAFMDRRSTWGWTAQTYRVPGVEGSEFSRDELEEFTRKRLHKRHGSPPRTSYSDKILQHSAGCLGVLRAHARAVQEGLEFGYERFVIMEDDAAIRTDMFIRIDTPPENAGFVGWGGLLMLGFKSDDDQWASGGQGSWKQLNGRSAYYGAHCYELTRPAAEYLLALYQKEDATSDDAWHGLFDYTPSYRCAPQIVTQLSGSVSDVNGRARENGKV